MYTRQIDPAPDTPVNNGKALFGTYSGSFKRFDIRNVRRPFGDLPLPVILTNLRVMEMLRFVFCDDEYIGEIELFDAGYFSYMETTVWNRITQRKFAYRRLLPPGLMPLPKKLDNTITACRTRKRYLRILTRLARNQILADFDFVGSDFRPPCSGHLEMRTDGPSSGSLSCVTPWRVKRRCQASWQSCGPLSGFIRTGFEDHEMLKDSSAGFFDLRQAYYSLRTKSSRMIGLGWIGGALISFQLGNPVSGDENRYNDNVLFIDNEVTPLPPVRITRPEGISGPWIIQDTESMIDLVFHPVSDSYRQMSAFVVRTSYHSVYGTFDGVLLSGSGEKLQLKGFPGIGKKILLRI